MKYTIKYKANNRYQASSEGALWQFLIIPEENDHQILEHCEFTNSLNRTVEKSINGYGFETFRINAREIFKEVNFEAEFRLEKIVINPFDEIDAFTSEKDYELLDSLDFRVTHEQFLRETPLTALPKNNIDNFVFDLSTGIFENLQELNNWIFKNFKFKTNVTSIDTNLSHVIENKKGVCQDFTHLFCAMARKNKIPTRYVSGYLHQGNGYFGDSQMHAWAESFIPGRGWIGFDPTNNLIAVESHVKVAHGKDYSDCPPIKGIVFTSGPNETNYSVEVTAQQQQQQQ